MNNGRLMIVVGGQFGSEGKGHLTAQLSTGVEPSSLVIRTGGPNAGHTVWGPGSDGHREYKLRHLPTPVAVNDKLGVALAARSVIDPRVLREELALFPGRTVFIDPAATILEPGDLEYEDQSNQMVNIGSTRKGIGAARMRRIARTARTAVDLWGPEGTEIDPQIVVLPVRDMAYAALSAGRDVIIEAAQGYGLGLHTEFYPYTTSADCCAIDALADAQISPWALGDLQPEVWMAIRPYPIRVAGTSGPLRDETTWGELGLPEERTTVTNKVRRVGHWDGALVRNAMWANGSHRGAVRLALLMADQIAPAIAGIESADAFREVCDAGKADDLLDLVGMIEADTGGEVDAFGTGPETMVFL